MILLFMLGGGEGILILQGAFPQSVLDIKDEMSCLKFNF